MSSFLSGVGKVAGVVATVAAFIPGGQGVAAIASAVALAANIGAAITYNPPPTQYGSSQIQIGANMPSPCAIGPFYSGGSRVHQAAWGTENDVPNAYAGFVDVYSVAGPIAAIDQEYIDFTAVNFDGSGKAIGFYSNNTLYRAKQLGATPEVAALAPHWTGMPNWGASYKLSGKAVVLWSARRPKDGKRFAAGFPQTGVRGRGVLSYDPRLDSTYPGGSGAHRWASPADKAAFSTAKATWTYSDGNPGVEALNYLLGRWERDETDSDAEYRKVFGVGGGIDQIVVEDFVEFANVCDANGWTCGGILYEGGGLSKWDNFLRILSAGGAAPCFKGARLGLRINAPRVPVATITMKDIGQGEPVIAGTVAYEARKNTLNPYFVSFDHKNEMVPSTPVQVTAYVTEDGEERPEDFKLELVQSADQINQLAGYELVGRRERGFTLPVLRQFLPGALVAFDAAVVDYYGVPEEAIVTRRSVALGSMRFANDFLSETPGKHAFALALTGTTPPVPALPTPEEIDEAAGAVNDQTAILISTSTQVDLVVSATDTTITISDHIRRYADVDVDVTGATLTGLTAETQYHLYYDDPDREGGAVTYHATEDYFEAFLSAANPRRHYAGFIRTDASGGSGTSGGGALPPGGGGSSPYEQDLIVDGQVPLA